MQEFQSNDTVNNRYRVIRKLGAGAMGSVYLCEDSVANNVRVALKVLVSDNLDDQDVWAKGEYEALTRLRHPNLAKVFNFGRIAGTHDYFIVSEFIKGTDLFSATEYLNYEELVDIIVQICRALEYIHAQGYVHFDIKPDNILVTRHKTIGIQEGSKVEFENADFTGDDDALLSKPKVKLIDFGLAEKITGSFSFAIKGTLNYLAPEILNGQTPDKRADLYSLGVTIYQVVNRSLPFYQEFSGFPDASPAPGATRADLFEMYMKNHPEYLRTLIMRLLEERVEQRYQSAKDVIQFINRSSGYKFEIETEETRASYFYSAKLVGRKREMNLLKELHEKTFYAPGRQDSEGSTELVGIDPSLEAEAPVDQAAKEEPESGGTPSEVPAVVVVSGEMGSGKSRLLEEFQHFLRLNDLCVYCGNCYEGSKKAYQPFVQLLNEIVYRFGLDSDLCRKYSREITKLLPELPKRNADDEGGARLDKERLYFIERVSQLLIEAAESSPYVMIINNLHWVDDASLDLLEHFAERLAELRSSRSVKMLLVVSMRPEEPAPESLAGLLEKWRLAGQSTDLIVRSLKEAQIYEFLCAMLSFTDVPQRFVAKLAEKTGGNPLFIVETLKTLQDEGILRHSADGWSIKAANYDCIDIPQNMEDMLTGRFDKLDVRKREVLELLSVLDKPTAPRFLQRFERFANVPLLVELRELEQSGLISKSFEGGKIRFQIEQTKMREILYDRMEEETKRRYHGDVAAVYEEVYRGREEEILEELAFHFQRSDQTSRAIETAMMAGDRLKAIYANEDACEYYLYVMEQVDGDADRFELWVEVHEKLGELCTIMGRYEMAERSYSVVLGDEGLESLDPKRVVKLYISRGRVYEIQGDYDSALTCYKDARNYLANFGKNDLVIERIWMFNSIGWVYVNMGKYDKAMAISLEALRVIEHVPERLEHAMVFNTIGSANFYKGNIGEAIKYHRRSLEIKENLENIPETIVSLNHLAAAFLVGCEYGEALEHLGRALATSEEIGDPYGRALTLHNFSRLYFKVGQPDKGWESLDESMKLSKEYSMRYLNIQNYVVRGAALREQGEFSKAEGNFFRALTAFTKQGNRCGLCEVLLQIAALQRLRGNHAEGAGMVTEGKCYAEEMDSRHLRVQCLMEEARLKREAGEEGANEALQLLEKSLSLCDSQVAPELAGEANFEMAETLVRLRLLREATQYYKAAEKRFREVFDILPEEFRNDYAAQQKKRFRDWRQSVVIPKAEKSSSPAKSPAESDTNEPAVLSAEDSLRRVNDLMVFMQSDISVQVFLDRFLDELLEVFRGDAALWLTVNGQNLSLEAARSSAGALEVEPEGILCLDVIEGVLAKGESLIVADMADDQATAGHLRAANISLTSLVVLSVQITATHRGVLYMTDAKLPGQGTGSLWLLQPFLNLVPFAYQQLEFDIGVA